MSFRNHALAVFSVVTSIAFSYPALSGESSGGNTFYMGVISCHTAHAKKNLFIKWDKGPFVASLNGEKITVIMSQARLDLAPVAPLTFQGEGLTLTIPIDLDVNRKLFGTRFSSLGAWGVLDVDRSTSKSSDFVRCTIPQPDKFIVLPK